MDNQLQEEGGPAEDLAGHLMAETRPQASFEIQPGEELLKEDQAGVGGEGLLLEFQFGDGVGLTLNLGSAKLHRANLLVAIRCW
jgi:hypothetical protein